MKKIVLMAAVVLALVGASSASAANEENGGGQYVKLCYVDHGPDWNGNPIWVLTPNC